MTTPQNVSSRYARNLIVSGRNSNFELEKIVQEIASSPSGIPVGFYYVAIIKRSTTFDPVSSDGATPEQAVTNCLVKFGVSFK